MNSAFQISSSDPAMLAKARQVAEAFAQGYIQAGVSGVVFLGAIARGYFDAFADIDIILYKSGETSIQKPPNYLHVEGFEIQSDLHDVPREMQSDWGMAKRWAFSQAQIYYDPSGEVARLLAEKVPLQAEERRWLMIQGMSHADWYIHNLPRLWIARGDLVNAQSMFSEGLTYFIQALFGLNNQLVADVKWRAYAAARLPLLPPAFSERVQAVMRCLDFTQADIERRQQAFEDLWRWALPRVEAEVGMPFEEYTLLV